MDSNEASADLQAANYWKERARVQSAEDRNETQVERAAERAVPAEKPPEKAKAQRIG